MRAIVVPSSSGDLLGASSFRADVLPVTRPSSCRAVVSLSLSFLVDFKKPAYLICFKLIPKCCFIKPFVAAAAADDGWTSFLPQPLKGQSPWQPYHRKLLCLLKIPLRKRSFTIRIFRLKPAVWAERRALHSSPAPRVCQESCHFRELSEQRCGLRAESI